MKPYLGRRLGLSFATLITDQEVEILGESLPRLRRCKSVASKGDRAEVVCAFLQQVEDDQVKSIRLNACFFIAKQKIVSVVGSNHYALVHTRKILCSSSASQLFERSIAQLPHMQQNRMQPTLANTFPTARASSIPTFCKPPDSRWTHFWTRFGLTLWREVRVNASPLV